MSVKYSAPNRWRGGIRSDIKNLYRITWRWCDHELRSFLLGAKVRNPSFPDHLFESLGLEFGPFDNLFDSSEKSVGEFWLGQFAK
jgi:hypothetical protein